MFLSLIVSKLWAKNEFDLEKVGQGQWSYNNLIRNIDKPTHRTQNCNPICISYKNMSKYMNLTLKKWVKVKCHVIIGFAILTNICLELKIMFLSLIVSKLWVKNEFDLEK